jgi:hypothetical protein
MIARAGSGWQTLMADLSIILFMVTAAALSQTKDGVAAPAPMPSARGEPLAVYRNASGAPSLSQWLAAQAPDPRQQLSIVAHYPPGGQQSALAEAAQLLGQAGTAGMTARLVVEPGEGGVVAVLAYDASVAQPLQGSPQTPKSPETK